MRRVQFPAPATAVVLSILLALASSAAAQAPVQGDALVDASIGDVNNLIPALASDTVSSGVVGNIYQGLLKYDKDLNLVGDLAESWEISEDQLVVTFHLRPGVVWEDGTPFTAEDCVFTWKLMSDPLTPTPYASNFLEIEKAEALDDLTLRVTYGRVMAKALETWSFYMMPKHLLEGRDLDESPLATRPVGVGPFRFKEWLANQRVVLEASPSYWEGRPHLDRLITRIIPEKTTQWMEFVTGAIDLMTLEPDQWTQVESEPTVKANYDLFRYPAFAYTYLGFNLKDPRLADVRVRKAIAMAIDKDEIVEGVLLGLGRPTIGPFRPDMWAYNHDLKPHPHDLALARQLMAEAGWTDEDGDGKLERDGERFVLTIMTNLGNANRENAALVIQSNLKEIGVEVKLRVVEWTVFLNENLDKRDFEAVVMGWTIPLDPDLYDVWNSKKTGPGELNFISYANDEVDELIDAARFTLDRAKRKAAYDRVQEILHDEVPYVFLYVPDNLVAVSKRFVGPELSPSGVGHNVNFWYVPKDLQRYQQ